jgi:hypothetical protein
MAAQRWHTASSRLMQGSGRGAPLVRVNSPSPRICRNFRRDSALERARGLRPSGASWVRQGK